MRKWPLNSITLVAATHRKLEKTADGTSTQVVTCMINKLRAKINGKEEYNVRNPLGMGDRKIDRGKTVAIWVLAPSTVFFNLLWVAATKVILFRSHFLINTVRSSIVGIQCGGDSFSWNCSPTMLPWLAHCVSPFCLGRPRRLSLKACRFFLLWPRFAEDRIVLGNIP